MFKVKVNKVLQVKEIANDLKEAFEALIEVYVYHSMINGIDTAA